MRANDTRILAILIDGDLLFAPAVAPHSNRQFSEQKDAYYVRDVY